MNDGRNGKPNNLPFQVLRIPQDQARLIRCSCGSVHFIQAAFGKIATNRLKADEMGFVPTGAIYLCMDCKTIHVPTPKGLCLLSDLCSCNDIRDGHGDPCPIHPPKDED